MAAVTVTVCLSASTLGYPQGGGHRWVYLNWALGLRALGCRVIWLEAIPARASPADAWANVAVLKAHLEPYGPAAERVALFATKPNGIGADAYGCLDVTEAAAEADLLLNFRYGTPADVVRRFRRSALVDIDPGLLQVWLSMGRIQLPRHDLYFSTGETVGQPGARFPDAGLTWHYTPPCVALDWWPERPAVEDAAFTTVSHWHMGEWMQDGEEAYSNDKRTGFLPFLDLPRRVPHRLELALCFGADDKDETAMLREQGWRVRDAWDVAPTPWAYQRYIQTSRGEFSCVKPSCVRLQNAWVSDRTLCYLASGKPAVVQHTGPSRFLPDAEGLLRFRDLDGASRALAAVATDYEHHCRQARALTEQCFSARTAAARVLEKVLA